MRASTVVAAGLVVASGCDTVFGLERGDSEDVTVTLVQRFYLNGEDGKATVLDRGFVTAELPSIEVFTDEGTRIPVELDNPLTSFEFPRQPGARYRVVLHLAERAEPLEIQSDTPELTFRSDVFHRPDAAPAAPFTNLTGTLAPLGTATQLFTTGVISQSAVDNGVPYVVHPPYMIDSSRNDRAFFARYSDTPTITIAELAEVSIRMAVGQNMRDVTLDPVSPTLCAHVRADVAGELARLTAAYPDATELDTGGWNLIASPAADLPTSAGFTLAYTLTGMNDTDVPYVAPFPGFTTTVQMGVQRTKRVNAVLALFAGTSVFDRFLDDDACTVHEVRAGLVGLPVRARIGDTLLDRDDAVVRLGAQPVLTFDVEGPADLLEVRLDDVTSGVLRSRVYVSATPRITLDPALFEQGHTYAFELLARRGYSQAATGDFATFATPGGSAYAYSSLFTIAPD